MTDKVWDETQTELSKNWISSTGVNHRKFLAKRFGLAQKNKVRMIDDFTCRGINSAYGLSEKLRVQSVDRLCAYLSMLLDDDSFDKKESLSGWSDVRLKVPLQAVWCGRVSCFKLWESG